MKRLRDARRRLLRSSRAGNPPLVLGLLETLHEGHQTCAQHAGVSFTDCGVCHNQPPLAASGSSLASPRGLEGYGPQRRRSSLKVLGGSLPRQPGELRGGGEALGSSTSERAPRGTASSRTSPVPSLAQVLLEAMESERASDLDSNQVFYFDLCQQDLLAASQTYRTTGLAHHGQQLLTDLRRMHNLVHQHLCLPGDLRPPLANVYVISQVLTTILDNPDGLNLCFGNAPFRCWCWSGAFAEDAATAWGHTQTAVRRCLSESQGQLLSENPDLQSLWAHFPSGHQADAADFVGFLWAQSDSTFYGGKFYHRRLQGTMEIREQMPLNLIFPLGEHSLTLDELVCQWADEEGGQFLYGARFFNFGSSKNRRTPWWRTLRLTTLGHRPRRPGKHLKPSPSSMATSHSLGPRYRTGPGLDMTL